MRNDHIDPEPLPEQLAAFLDGELEPAARARVDARLAADPAAAAEIDGQRRVARLWAGNPPPEPAPAAWDATLAAIEARLPAARPRRPRRRMIWLGAAAAAAVVVCLLLPRLAQHKDAPKTDNNDPLPVIGPRDVVVVSMDARDAAGLVVAAPPVQEPIVLASQDDVSIMNVESYWNDDGQVAQIGEGEVPMIVAPPVARAGGRGP